MKNSSIKSATDSLQRINVIKDVPTEQDLLSDDDIKPHEKVANAISDLIISDEGGIMIGLEGGWGAGKSSVIRMISRILSKDKNISLFQFDAWAHEGDSLRRTFLESIVEHFSGFWISEKTWDDNLKKITGKYRKTHTISTAKATKFSKILAFLTLLVPFGIALFNEGMDTGTNGPQGIDYLMVASGSVLTLAPFIYILVKLVCLIGKAKEQRKNEFDVLTGENIQDITEDVVETPEPTSIEFENYFTDLVKEALSEPQRKVVIVIDNLDRVDPEVAKKDWATLQTFLRNKCEKELFFKRLWIIVPYSLEGIGKIWNRDEIEYVNDPISASFLDKSFQVRFTVPPPILSNWVRYLETTAKKAFPGFSEDDCHQISSVYSIGRRSKYDPTPRELILYINQIGTFLRQSGNDIPIGHISYYVLLQRGINDIRDKLIKGEIPDAKMELALSGDIKGSIASLFFNVPTQQAQQLLLEKPIYESLINEDIEELRRLEQTHDRGFWRVLEIILSTRFSEERKDFLKAVTSIHEAKLCEKTHAKNKADIVKQCMKTIAFGSKWDEISETTTKGLCCLFSIIPDVDIMSKIVLDFRNAINNISIEGDDWSIEIAMRPTISSIFDLIECVTSLGQNELVSAPFELNIDVNAWAHTSSNIISKFDKEKWASLKPNFDPNELIHYLSEIIKAGDFTEREKRIIEVTLETQNECEFKSVAYELGNRLKHDKNAITSECYNIMLALESIKAKKIELSDIEKPLVEEGHIAHKLYQAKADNQLELIAYYVLLYLSYRPSFEAPSVHVGHSQLGLNELGSIINEDNSELAQEIVQILDNKGSFGLLIDSQSEKGEVDPLVLNCYKLVIDKGKAAALFRANELEHNWSYYVDVLNDEETPSRVDDLVKQLVSNGKMIDEICKSDDGFQTLSCGLYLSIINNTEPEISKPLVDWCSKSFEGLDRDSWILALTEHSDCLRLLLKIKSESNPIVLGLELQDALKEYAHVLMRDDLLVDKHIGDNWPSILNFLPERHRVNLRYQVLSSIMENIDSKTRSGFFDLFGDEISELDILNAEKERIVRKLFQPILVNRNIAGLSWSLSVFTKEKGFLDTCDPSQVDEYKERIYQEYGNEMSDEAHEIILSIAELLEIDKPVEANNDEARTFNDTETQEIQDETNGETDD